MGRPTTEDADEGSGRDPVSGDRVALWVFCAALVVAVPVLFHAAREQWFFLDEWDFLADRDLMSLNDVLRPHNEHWHSLGVVTYRLIFQVVGTRAYWPYLVPVITAHLASVVLVRVVMRRAGADAWIATAGCIALLFLGPGKQNILWGFQIGFTGSVALGLAALLLAGRHGPLGRWDAAAVAVSVLALAASTIGVAMVGAIGVTCVLRRQWLRAAVQAGVPALVFVGWFLVYGRDARAFPRPNASQGASFVGWLAVDSFEGLAGPALIALVLAAAAVVGLVVAGRSSIRTRGDDDALGDERGFARAEVMGLAAAAAAVAVSAAYGRAAVFPVERGASSSRYIHLVVVLLAPAVVLGLTLVAAKIPIRAVGVAGACLLLLVGLPGNIDNLELQGVERLTRGNPGGVAVLAAVAVDLNTPPHLRLPAIPYDGLTAGWLRDAVASGDLEPAEPPYEPVREAAAITMLSLDDSAPAPTEPCAPFAGPTTLEPGDVLHSPTSSLAVEAVTGPGGATITYLSPELEDPQVTLRAVRRLRVRSATPAQPDVPVELCTAG